MKIHNDEIAPSGKRRILFATNVKELELISGIIQQAYLHFPRCNATMVEFDRLKNIKSALIKGLKGIE